MQTLARGFLKHKNNPESKTKTEAIANEITIKHPNFWGLHQSFENYRTTLSRSQNWTE